MLSQAEKHELLKIAKDTLTQYFASSKIPPITVTNPALRAKTGAFVTLHTREGQLRGCIGFIEAVRPLYQTIQKMAVAAAVQDPRFPPVTQEELSRLKFEISVLSPLKKVRRIDEIEVGQHGLIIRQEFYSGLLLPQVATEYGWNREEFLAHTCQKAGLPADAWKKNAEIYIFTADVFS